MSLSSPTAGKLKYHLCLGQNEFTVTLCFFLNSKNRFASDLVFDTSRFPMLPPSPTGKSIVSLSMVPRFTEQQLLLYGAAPLGMIDKDVAAEILAACRICRTLTTPERTFAVEALTAYVSQ